MVGIYMITNLVTGQKYIGQSHDIERRIKAHKNDKNGRMYPIMNYYNSEYSDNGEDMFYYEVLEECKPEELDAKEIHYINYYNTRKYGYNIAAGGQNNKGESNANCKLLEQDVYNIREAYKNHINKREVYKLYQDKISWMYFSNLWEGNSWPEVHMDVYTEENKIFYKTGFLRTHAEFTDEEVMNLRNRYVNETAGEIFESVKDRCNYQTLQQLLWGRNYSHLPIYDKKHKKWINN